METKYGLQNLIAQLKEENLTETETLKENIEKLKSKVNAIYSAKVRRLEKETKEKAEKEAKQGIQLEIANKQRELQAMELDMENELLSRLQGKFREGVYALIGTDKYYKWLRKELSIALTNLPDAALIHLKKEDLAKTRDLLVGLRVVLDDDIKGGFIIRTDDGRFLMDYTLDEMIREYNPILEKELKALLQGEIK